MESTVSGTIEGVVGRQVNTQRGTATVFDVTVGGKKLSTFKNEIAEEANALQGSTVEAQVQERRNGDYTNYTLLGLKLVNAGSAVTTNGNTATSTIPVAAPAAEKKGWQPEDTERVTRLSCLSTAFQYAGQIDGSVEDALTLAQRLYIIAMGGQGVLEQPVAAVSPSEATEDFPW